MKLISILALTLCITVFFPVIVYADETPIVYADETPGTGVPIEADKLPGYALFEDGSPNPAFLDADGKLYTVSPKEYAEIVADWIAGGGGLLNAGWMADEGGQFSSITPSFAQIMPLASSFPYFFHISGQYDPYGSGHHYRQYYVPAGSDVPQLSFCLEMGKNAPPDSVKVAYTPMGEPSWSTALATFAPAILNSYGIDTMSDNAHRYWSMQDAVWILTGSGVGAAAGAPVIQSLVSAAHQSANASNPVFNGITDGGALQAVIYDKQYVRYGPFSISGMDGTATMSINLDSGASYPAAMLVDGSGAMVSLSSVPGEMPLYILLPRYLNESRQITVTLNAPYVLPSTMSAYSAPSSSYQNQLVMTNWTPRSGTLTVSTRLGGFGGFEITKLDSGWLPDCGDIYLLDGAVFKIQQWNGSAFTDAPGEVVYDLESRTYRTAWLTESTSNGGWFRITETTIPYGYRDPAVFEFSLRGKYDLVTGDGIGSDSDDIKKATSELNNKTDASYYILNNLLNVRIELMKRDSADKGPGAARPQGGATLEGAYYGLFYAEAATDPSGTFHGADELVCIGITNEEGRVVFEDSAGLIWSNSNTVTNYGSDDFPLFLPSFERHDKRIYPAKYYIQELVPSKGYLLDIDPETAELDINGVPLPGTGQARKYEADAYDYGSAQNPAGIRIEVNATETVKKRGFLLRKIRSDGYETEMLNLNGAGFSVYFVDDLMAIIEKAAQADPDVKVPQRGPGGWEKQDFIDFFYDADYVHPISEDPGKDWYEREGNIYTGRYDFDLYPELKRARIDYTESPVFYSGAALIPGLSYGEYGNSVKPKAGEVVFPEFPYGEYIVFETFVPPGVERIKPFIVSILEDGGDVYDGDGVHNFERPEQGWRLQADSDMFSIRLWKKDAETGRIVIGKDAAFMIRQLGPDGTEGKWVEMVVPAGSGSVRWGTAENPFRVGSDGVLILPRKLKAGSYKLYEVEAPLGYVLSYHEAVDKGGYYWSVEPEPQPDVGIVFDANEVHRVIDFDIDVDGYDDFVLELVQYNEQQKGRINIHKEREMPYQEGTAPMRGVLFELYAAEDIYSLDGHGQVIYMKDELVESAFTNEDGNAWFKNLHLGLYLLKEADIDEGDKTWINGKLLSGYKYVDDIEIDLRPPEGAGQDKSSPFFQERAFILKDFSLLDTWQLGKAEVNKSGRRPGDDGIEEGPLEGVVFEVTAREDVACINTGETIWKKGDIVGTIVTDEEGWGCIEDLLPGEYVLRETDAPEGYIFMEDLDFTINLREHSDPFEWHTWDLTNIHKSLLLIIKVEVDKDTIKRTSAAFVSLPGQAGFNNVGKANERYRYNVDFRSTSSTWADELVVDDPLENAVHRKIFVDELWTPVVWGDYDGLWNLWYATNKTDRKETHSHISAMDSNPYNPDNPDNVSAYPNTGLRLLAQGLKTDERYHFTLEDFGLEEGEYLTHLRYEYGRVEVGFTSKNYSSVSLNGEHRTISGADLKLPSDAVSELMLLDPLMFDAVPPAEFPGIKDNYTTGIKGDVVDWTPIEGTLFYAPGAVDPGYELKPATYLVSAVKAMEDIDIVSSVSARIARNMTLKDYDQDAVVTREIGTFMYEDELPIGVSAMTLDEFPLLFWLLAFLSASIGMLVIGHVTINKRLKARRHKA